MVGNQGQERVAGVRRGEVRLALQEAWLYVFDGSGLRRPLDGDELRRATAKSIGGVFFLWSNRQRASSLFWELWPNRPVPSIIWR